MPRARRHDVASGVRARLVFADVAGVDELLHVAVVDRGAVQHALAQQVRARVADVDEGETSDVGFVGTKHHQRRQGRAHPVMVDAGVCRLVDRRVGLDDRGDDHADVAGAGAQPVADDARGDVAGDLAGLMSTHAIGDPEHHRLAHVGVFVAGPYQPDVRRCTPTNGRLVGERDVVAHHSASNTVLPTCTRSPLVTCSGAVRRLPLR